LSTNTAIDLRSDTVTRPTPAMRRAMAEAEVGDDVFREDPTVRLLEEEAAEAAGKEAALFVPSGTMGNQIALHIYGRPGHEVLCGATSHVLLYEMGAMAVLSGLQPKTLPDPGGKLDPAAVAGAINPSGGYGTPTGILSLESSHNMAGGTVQTPDALREVASGAHFRGLPVHLDGARIFNAAEALGVPVADIAAVADSVMFCLSKGLGAPVGSMLCGSEAFIGEAHRVRKMLGGGMRQVGVLAAAGLIALREGPRSLAQDHAHARRLAEALVQVPGISVDPEAVVTNIILVKTEESQSAGELVQRLRVRDVLVLAIDENTVRLVTHRDVTPKQVEKAIEIFGSLGEKSS